MNKYLESVKQFHEAFNHPVEITINDDNLKLRELRLSLLFEELIELSNAMGTNEHLKTLLNKHLNDPVGKGEYDKLETLDALGDIQYVLSGAVLALGYTNVFDDAFDEIQRSNMSKMCDTLEDAEETKDHYYLVKNETKNIKIEEKDGKYILVREDGKILKNIHYSEADLSQFLE